MSRKNHPQNSFVKALLEDNEKRGYNPDDDSFIAIASTDAVDRYGEVVESSAWKLGNFRKNPVLLACHNMWGKAIGRVLWIKNTADGLKFKLQFAETEEGQEFKYLYKNGFMSAFSVGFYSNDGEIRGKKEKEQYHHTDVELLEISCVAVPANPDALLNCLQSGNVKTATVKSFIEEVTTMKDPNDDDHEDDTTGIESLERRMAGLEEAIKVLTERIEKAKEDSEPKPPIEIETEPENPEIAKKIAELIEAKKKTDAGQKQIMRRLGIID